MGSIYTPGTSINVDSQTSNAAQEFIASAAQTVFTLTAFTYTPSISSLPNTGALAIYRNGQRLLRSQYTETNSTTVTLVGVTLAAGESINIVAVIGDTSSNAAASAVSAAAAAASATNAAANAQLSYAGGILSVNAKLSVLTAGTVGLPSMYFGADTTTGWYRISANNTGYAVSGAKVLDISSAGLGVVGTLSATTGAAVGGATAGTGGIAFPAVAVTVADVNTLDDYQEGTWTPGISFGGGTTGITYSIQAGTYTVIGDRVFCTCQMIMTNKGSSTGAAKIAGLPFTVFNSNGAFSPAALRFANITFADFPMGYCDANSVTVILEETTNAGTTTSLTDVDFSNTSQVMASFNYKIA